MLGAHQRIAAIGVEIHGRDRARAVRSLSRAARASYEDDGWSASDGGRQVPHGAQRNDRETDAEGERRGETEPVELSLAAQSGAAYA